MKTFTLLVTLAFTFQFVRAAPKGIAPTATSEEVIEQFDKTWTGIDLAVQAADSKLKEILTGNELLPQVEKLMFDGEFIIATIATGALNELIVNPNVNQHQLVIDVLTQTGIIVVQTISDVEQVLKNQPEDLNAKVFQVFYDLLEECEAQVAPLIDLIEG